MKAINLTDNGVDRLIRPARTLTAVSAHGATLRTVGDARTGMAPGFSVRRASEHPSRASTIPYRARVTAWDGVPKVPHGAKVPTCPETPSPTGAISGVRNASRSGTQGLELGRATRLPCVSRVPEREA